MSKTSTSKTSGPDIKQLRAIGHKLKPIVTVAGKGLNENVLAEIERALRDHELVKIKLMATDRDARKALAGQICEQTGADRIQSIGNIILILRRSSQPDPRLSNLLRTL
ncbi:MAG: YhbY family RNA-binding protein [Parahaliea sp.]